MTSTARISPSFEGRKQEVPPAISAGRINVTPTAAIASGITITELILPSWEDRHCPECGLIEPHHHCGCIWRD